MKLFDNWNHLKKQLDNSKPAPDFYVNNREIWYAHIWINIRFEQNGKGEDFKRPVLVLKKLGNVFLVIPMTSRQDIEPKNERFYYTLPNEYFWKKSSLILSQIRVIDRTRFIEKLKMVHHKDFINIKKKLKAFLSL